MSASARSQNGKLKGDAAIALLSSSALAIGVMTVSMTSGMNTDVNNYMFGSILSLSSADLRLSLILSAAVLEVTRTGMSCMMPVGHCSARMLSGVTGRSVTTMSKNGALKTRRVTAPFKTIGK